MGVSSEPIVVGGDSIALLQQLVQAARVPGDRIVFAWRSYEAYPVIVRVCGTIPIMVSLQDGRHDLPALARAVTESAVRIVLVCKPNTPTGTAETVDELVAFTATVPKDCIVVLDEAYIDFNEAAFACDAVALVKEHPNLAVSRTVSKADGLAGLRVGWCLADWPVADGHAFRGISVRVFADKGVRNTIGEPDALAILRRIAQSWTGA